MRPATKERVHYEKVMDTGEKLRAIHSNRGAAGPATDGHQGNAPPAHNFGTINAMDLCAKEFAPVQWAVPGILPAGVSLLAGAPKTGKSWMALDFALAVAGGNSVLGKVQVDPGTVLYLALEDNQRRLKSRILKRLAGSPPPANLHFQTEWARLDQGAADRLREWMECHPDTRLIIIDTLAKIRPPSRGNASLYTEDYAIGAPLLKVAAEYGVAILLVHHTKKGECDDPLELVSGSFGLSGGVDNVLILQRNRGTCEASLYVTGRDIESETKYGLEWDSQIAAWTVQGEGPHVGLSPERRKVYDIIAEQGPIASKNIATRVHPGIVITKESKEWANIRFLLKKLTEGGLIQKTDKGYITAHTTHTTHTDSLSDDGVSGGSVSGSGVSDARKTTHTTETANGAAFGESVSGVSGVSDVVEPYGHAPTSPPPDHGTDRPAVVEGFL